MLGFIKKMDADSLHELEATSDHPSDVEADIEDDETSAQR